MNLIVSLSPEELDFLKQAILHINKLGVFALKGKPGQTLFEYNLDTHTITPIATYNEVKKLTKIPRLESNCMYGYKLNEENVIKLFIKAITGVLDYRQTLMKAD